MCHLRLQQIGRMLLVLAGKEGADAKDLLKGCSDRHCLDISCINVAPGKVICMLSGIFLFLSSLHFWFIPLVTKMQRCVESAGNVSGNRSNILLTKSI